MLSAIAAVFVAIAPVARPSAFPGANGKIVYQRNGSGTEQVVVANADGSSPVTVATVSIGNAEPRFSPDGVWVTYQDMNGSGDEQVMLTRADGSTATNPIDVSALAHSTASEGDPTFTPDGKHLIFDRQDPSNFSSTGLFEMTPDGLGVSQLTTGQDRHPAVSPDGTHVAYAEYPAANTATTAQIMVAPIAGTAAQNMAAAQQLTTTVTYPQERPDWSPDGTQIAYDQQTSSSFEYHVEKAPYVAGASPATPTDLTPNPPSHDNYEPAFSPDGTQILFATDRTVATNDGIVEEDGIWVMNADGSNPHAVQDPILSGSGSTLKLVANFYSPDWAALLVTSGSRATETNAGCPTQTVGQPVTCSVSVTDTDTTGSPSAPAGTVTWSSDKPGAAFGGGGSCTLVPSPSYPNASTCELQYASPDSDTGTDHLTATYVPAGTAHAASSDQITDSVIAPPQAVTQHPSFVSATEIDLQGVIDSSEGLDTRYYFQWGPSLTQMVYDTPAYPGTDVGANIIQSSPKVVSATLTGLTASTTYCFRLVAVNAAGTTYAQDAGSGDPGGGIPPTRNGFCQQTAAPPSAPIAATGAASSTGATSEHLTGTVNPENQPTRWFFQYSLYKDLQYAGGGQPANVAGEVPVQSPGAQLNGEGYAPIPVGADISGLTAGDTYYYRLVASNATGASYDNARSYSFTVPRPENKCPHELDFGPAAVTAGPLIVSQGSFSIGYGCLTREGLTWTTTGSITFAGIHLSADAPNGKIIIDPLNLQIRTVGSATVSIGPWFVGGRQVGPITVYNGPFDWVFQGGPLANKALSYLQSLGHAGGLPQLKGPNLPPGIVHLPQLPSLPQLGGTHLPDFSGVQSFDALAKLIGANPGNTYSDLSQPTVKINPNLVPDVSLPESCIGTEGAQLAGLTLNGELCVTIKDNTTTVDGTAELPSDLADAFANVKFTLQPNGTVTNVSGEAFVGGAEWGPIELGTLDVKYDGNSDSWHGEGGGDLFGGAAGADASFDIVGGSLKNAMFSLDTGDLPIGATGMFLQKAGIGYTSVPDHTISGTAQLGYGPKLPTPSGGQHLLKLDVANPGVSYDFDKHFLSLGAQLSALTDPAKGTYTQLGSAALTWNGETGEIFGDVKFGLSQQVTFLNQKAGFSVNGTLAADFVPGAPAKFQMDAQAKAALTLGALNASFDADATVSTKGLAACADTTIQLPLYTFKGNAGFGYIWGGQFSAWATTGNICGLGAYRVMPNLVTRANASAAHAAAAGGGFVVPAGQRQLTVRLIGETGAPAVVLHGPGGQTVTTSTTDGFSGGGAGSLVFVDQAAKLTSVSLYKPAVGHWTLTLQPASPAIASAAGAYMLPEPNVHAHVVRHGGHYRLVYHLHPLAGQSVTLLEKGGGTARVIGTVTRAAGSIAFTPAYGRRGHREIIAEVTQDGLPRETDKVGHYTAPPPLRPRAPHIRIARHGSRATVSWRPVAGARAYAVRVRYDGYQQLVTRTKHIRLRLAHVFGNRPIVVAVTGLDRSGLPGRTGRATSAGKIPKVKKAQKVKKAPARHHHR